jgi:hypothetical protein
VIQFAGDRPGPSAIFPSLGRHPVQIANVEGQKAFKLNAARRPKPHIQKSLEYEQHAAKCRRMAAEMTTPQLKKQLEDAADVWDRLANERRRGIIETNPDS